MTIAVEKLPDCKARLEIQVPPDTVTSERNQVVSAYAAQAKVPGYRPGKTPRSVIEKKYAKQIEEELRQRLVQRALRQTVEEKDIEIIGIQQMERELFGPDGGFSLAAEVVTAPEISLPDYKGIEVTAPKINIEDDQVDSVLQRMQQNAAEQEEITGRPLQPGDIAVLSWTSTLDGKPLKEAISAGEEGEAEEPAKCDQEDDPEHVHDENCGHDHEHGPAQQADPGAQLIDFLAKHDDGALQLPEEGSDEEGREFFLPGFDTQLKGLEIGQSREVTVTIPDDFEAENLREKELVFSVTLSGLKEQHLPEIDDEFAEKVEAGSSLVRLRENIQKGLEQEQENMRQEMITNQILNHLGGNQEFELPEHLVFNETQRQVNQIVTQSYQRGAGENEIQEHQDQILQSAQQRAQSNLKVNFILEEIAKAEEIAVTNEELSRHVTMMAAQSGRPVKKVINQLKQSDGFGAIRHDLLIGKVLEFLRSNTNLTEVEPEEAGAAGAAAAESESAETEDNPDTA